MLMFRKSERKKNISRNIRAMTPHILEGLSSELGFIQESVFSWPQVVGILKGTDDPAHRRIRQIKPTRKTAMAKYGRTFKVKQAMPITDRHTASAVRKKAMIRDTPILILAVNATPNQ
jgi:hypothetical protein